jgi:hypothetical protein
VVTLKLFDEFKYLIKNRNEKIVKFFLLTVKIRDPMQTFLSNVAETRVNQKNLQKTLEYLLSKFCFF